MCGFSGGFIGPERIGIVRHTPCTGWGVSMRIEPNTSLRFPPPEPARVVAASSRAGTDDSRRCDAGRDEVSVSAFGAGPGAIPFADYLKASNLRSLAVGYPASGPRPSETDCGPSRGHAGCAQGSGDRADGLPRLGDVSPIDEESEADVGPVESRQGRAAVEVYLRPAATGRMIDVVF